MADTERPDTIIFDTIAEANRGRASLADVRAAIQLALEVPGWDERADEVDALRHLLTCPSCLLHAITSLAVTEAMAKVFGLLRADGPVPSQVFDASPVPAHVTRH